MRATRPRPASAPSASPIVNAMLILLFVSRGTPLLTAGDEFGRTQKGNNNAYAQDNEVTWLDWKGRDRDLEEFTAALSALRRSHPALSSLKLLSGRKPHGHEYADVEWFRADGEPMQAQDWENPDNHFLGMMLTAPKSADAKEDFVAVVINRSEGRVLARLPAAPKGRRWHCAISSKLLAHETDCWAVPAHTVAVFEFAAKHARK